MAGSTSQRRRSFGFRRTYIWLWSFLPLCRLQSICRVTTRSPRFRMPIRVCFGQWASSGVCHHWSKYGTCHYSQCRNHHEPRASRATSERRTSRSEPGTSAGDSRSWGGSAPSGAASSGRVSLTALGGPWCWGHESSTWRACHCSPLIFIYIYILYIIYIYSVSSVCFICVTYHVIHIK